jgi:hypothetical protein
MKKGQRGWLLNALQALVMCKTTHGDDTAASHAYPSAARARSTAIALSGRGLHSTTTHAPLVDVDDVCCKPGIIIIINLIKQQPHDVKPVGQRLWGSVRVRVWMENRCVCMCVCVLLSLCHSRMLCWVPREAAVIVSSSIAALA